MRSAGCCLRRPRSQPARSRLVLVGRISSGWCGGGCSSLMPAAYRQRVVRSDGRTITVVQRRAHLSYCFSGCCCGRTERGYAVVPVDTYKDEWRRRKLRASVHLTKGGCLGPCALANVASLVFDG